MNETKQIKAGALLSYFGVAINILAGLLYTPWMVRQIGQSDYGLYTLATSVTAFFLMDFGISGAISRLISRYRAQGREDEVKNILGLTYKMYLVIDGLIFLALFIIFLFMQNIFVRLSAAEIEKFRIVFVMVGFYSLLSFPFIPLNSILTSYEKFTALKGFDIFSKLLSISLVCSVLFLGLGLYALVLTNCLSAIVIIVLKLIYLKRRVHIKINFKFKDKKMLLNIFSFSIWATIISVAARLIINISPSILGMFSGAIQISVFSYGASLEGYTWMLANALNGLLLPKVTRITVQENNPEKITSLMIKVGRIQLLIIGLVAVGLITMGKEFIILLMGENFANSYYVALCLILPGVVTMTQDVAYNYLVAMNEIKWRALDYIGASVISILLSLLLTPKFGAVGAGVAAGIGIVIGHVIVMNVIYHRVFHLDIPRFFKECHLKLALPMILTAAVAVLLQVLFPVHSLILFFVKAVAVGAVYVLLMGLIGLNSFEKQLFLGPVMKIGNAIKAKFGKRGS